jgi:hypothetical protein
MVNALVNAETQYFAVIGRRLIDIDKALRMNEEYSEKLFELYHNTTNPEDRVELEFELNYLIRQADFLKKLNETGGNF